MSILGGAIVNISVEVFVTRCYNVKAMRIVQTSYYEEINMRNNVREEVARHYESKNEDETSGSR